jgi:hypothetical protein
MSDERRSDPRRVPALMALSAAAGGTLTMAAVSFTTGNPTDGFACLTVACMCVINMLLWRK